MKTESGFSSPECPSSLPVLHSLRFLLYLDNTRLFQIFSWWWWWWDRSHPENLNLMTSAKTLLPSSHLHSFRGTSFGGTIVQPAISRTRLMLRREPPGSLHSTHAAEPTALPVPPWLPAPRPPHAWQQQAPGAAWPCTGRSSPLVRLNSAQ